MGAGSREGVDSDQAWTLITAALRPRGIGASVQEVSVPQCRALSIARRVSLALALALRNPRRPSPDQLVPLSGTEISWLCPWPAAVSGGARVEKPVKTVRTL